MLVANGLCNRMLIWWLLGLYLLLEEMLGVSSHPPRCQWDISSAPQLPEATTFQGSGVPEKGFLGFSRGSPSLGQYQALKMVKSCLEDWRVCPGHEEMGIVLFQHLCLLGLVWWVKMCGSQVLAWISVFFSTATRGPLCWR